MGYILNIETSTKNCSVALAKNGTTIHCIEMAETNYSHAEKLHLYIENLMQSATLSFNDLTAIAVGQGPGSYTGLRIGVSAAKGLCFGLDIPLIAIDTMQIIVNPIAIDSGLIIPMIDAKRMEVYSAIFDHRLEKIRPTEAQIINANSFSEIAQPIYIVGDCKEKLQTVLMDTKFHFIENIIYPSAGQMSRSSYEKFLQKDFVNLAYFEPFYLKDFLITTKKAYPVT